MSVVQINTSAVGGKFRFFESIFGKGEVGIGCGNIGINQITVDGGVTLDFNLIFDGTGNIAVNGCAVDGYRGVFIGNGNGNTAVSAVDCNVFEGQIGIIGKDKSGIVTQVYG